MAALVGKRVARVTGRRGTIKLSEIDVPKCSEFRRWSIRAPHARLGRGLRTEREVPVVRFFLLRLGESGVQLHRFALPTRVGEK